MSVCAPCAKRERKRHARSARWIDPDIAFRVARRAMSHPGYGSSYRVDRPPADCGPVDRFGSARVARAVARMNIARLRRAMAISGSISARLACRFRSALRATAHKTLMRLPLT